MVLATFITICMAAVLFLIRFLFALESESRATRTRLGANAEPIVVYRGQGTGQIRESAPALILVYSNSSRQVA